MSLVGILVALLILGFVCYLVSLIPMNDTIRKIFYAVVALGAVLWVLQSLGFIHTGIRFR